MAFRRHGGGRARARRRSTPAPGRVADLLEAPAPGPTFGEVAARGLRGAGSELPHGEKIQAAFGGFDLATVRAHTGVAGSKAAVALGAEAYASGEDIAFKSASPSLRTAAHEAAHVLQQRAGEVPRDGVGRPGDRHERHADAVAERVAQGRSAEPLLRRGLGGAAPAAPGSHPGAAPRPAVQLQVTPWEAKGTQTAGPYKDTAAVNNFNSLGQQPNSNTTTGGWVRAVSKTADNLPVLFAPWSSYARTFPAAGPPSRARKSTKLGRESGARIRKRRNQAATMMHAVNAQLHGPGTPGNLFLGTQESNRIHKEQVEQPIYDTLKQQAADTSEITAYENVMKDANTRIRTGTILEYDNKYQMAGDQVGANAGMREIDTAAVDHEALAQAGTPRGWLTFTVTPNYPANLAGVPAYITNNIADFQGLNWNPRTHRKTPAQAAAHLAAFKIFAPEAFPNTFDNELKTTLPNYDPNAAKPWDTYESSERLDADDP